MICPGLCCTRNNKDDPIFLALCKSAVLFTCHFSNIAMFLLCDSLSNLHIMKSMSYITCLH